MKCKNCKGKEFILKKTTYILGETPENMVDDVIEFYRMIRIGEDKIFCVTCSEKVNIGDVKIRYDFGY